MMFRNGVSKVPTRLDTSPPEGSLLGWHFDNGVLIIWAVSGREQLATMLAAQSFGPRPR
jgi:hypothetical protein